MSSDTPFDLHALEAEILRIVQTGDTKLGNGYSGIVTRVLRECVVEDMWPRERVAEAIWFLVSRGLVYVSISPLDNETSGGPENWALMPTVRGRVAAGDERINPDMPQGYLERFARDIPGASDIVQSYVKEALECYTQRCYMACAVMTGAAAEAAFLDVAASFTKILKPDEARRLNQWISGTWRPYEQIRKEFMARLAPYRDSLPAAIKENLEVEIDAALALIRKYRNDAGHPTGFTMEHGACFLSLIALAESVRRIYALKAFLDGAP